MRPFDVRIVATLAVALVAAQPAFAQSGRRAADEQAAAAAKEREELEQRLRIIERQIEVQAQDAQAKPKEAAAANAGEKGFGIKSSDGSWEFKFKGLLQVDHRAFLNDAPAARFNDTFTFRRVEPVFELTLGKLGYFKLQPQFAGDTAATSDVYGELRFHPAFVLRAGKFKEPLSVENLQSAGAITFVERGYPSEISAGRDLGAQVQGEMFSGTTSYALGYFNGATDGRDAVSSDTDDHKEMAARLFFEPFKNDEGFLRGLGFGIAGSQGSKLAPALTASTTVTAATATYNNTLPRYRSPGQNTIFAYKIASTGTPTAADTVLADGDHTRLVPQLYFYAGSLSLMAEHASSEQDVSFNSVAHTYKHDASEVVASYVLTGEAASYRGPAKPNAPYTPGGEGWGAFEVGARYGVLDLDDAAFTDGAADATKSVTKATSAGVVLNWYLTGNVRVAMDYTSTKFEGGATSGDRADEKAAFTRLQLSF